MNEVPTWFACQCGSTNESNVMENYTFIALDQEPVKCNSFKEAFTAMFNWVQKHLNGEGLSYQVLETAIWIEINGRPLYFYDARDRAIDENILKDGKLIET